LRGYEAFHPFERSTLRLIEPLRLIYYLAWSARQRNDLRFRQSNPGWGSEVFWIKEIEDLRDQLTAIEEEG
jgi:Ser/Thr protein kinase RdoA (MazF antagonist)